MGCIMYISWLRYGKHLEGDINNNGRVERDKLENEFKHLNTRSSA